MRTREGQRVEAALSRSGTFLQIPFMIDHNGHIWDKPRGQTAKGWGPLYCLYKASDQCFFLAGHRDRDLQRLSTVAGLGGIEAIPTSELTAHLQACFASGSAQEWVRKINSAGLRAQVLVNYERNMESSVVKQRGLSVVRKDPEIGDVRNVGAPAKLSGTPLVSLFGAPRLGWHAREILDEIGYWERFEELVSAGVVGVPGN
jgi:crotonobetainyl-CoA:carnitine CoA-transferase CaiB-like acyl-CoA transferase